MKWWVGYVFSVFFFSPFLCSWSFFSSVTKKAWNLVLWREDRLNQRQSLVSLVLRLLSSSSWFFCHQKFWKWHYSWSEKVQDVGCVCWIPYWGADAWSFRVSWKLTQMFLLSLLGSVICGRFLRNFCQLLLMECECLVPSFFLLQFRLKYMFDFLT